MCIGSVAGCTTRSTSRLAPSSRTTNSSAERPGTGAPSLSRTLTYVDMDRAWAWSSTGSTTRAVSPARAHSAAVQPATTASEHADLPGNLRASRPVFVTIPPLPV